MGSRSKDGRGMSKTSSMSSALGHTQQLTGGQMPEGRSLSGESFQGKRSSGVKQRNSPLDTIQSSGVEDETVVKDESRKESRKMKSKSQSSNKHSPKPSAGDFAAKSSPPKLSAASAAKQSEAASMHEGRVSAVEGRTSAGAGEPRTLRKSQHSHSAKSVPATGMASTSGAPRVSSARHSNSPEEATNYNEQILKPSTSATKEERGSTDSSLIAIKTYQRIKGATAMAQCKRPEGGMAGNINFMPDEQISSNKGNMPPKAPGMLFDRKDTNCGYLLKYTVAHDDPRCISGTWVTGLRMDGANEGVYGNLAKKGEVYKKYMKELVGCFAGYFHMMGACMPECPDPCPPEFANVNFNSCNPLKKHAFEWDWMVRAGFLPEETDALELLDDSHCKNAKKSANGSTTTMQEPPKVAPVMQSKSGTPMNAAPPAEPVLIPASSVKSDESVATSVPTNNNNAASNGAALAAAPSPSRKSQPPAVTASFNNNNDLRPPISSVSSDSMSQKSVGNNKKNLSIMSLPSHRGYLNTAESYRDRIEEKLKRSRMRAANNFKDTSSMLDDLRSHRMSEVKIVASVNTLRAPNPSRLSLSTIDGPIAYKEDGGGECQRDAQSVAASSAIRAVPRGRNIRPLPPMEKARLDSYARPNPLDSQIFCKERNWIPKPASGMI